MGSKIEKFTDLIAWKEGHELVIFIYNITEKFPKEDRYGLSSQFQRASQSIALNIGEGSGGSNSEFKQFIKIARRSVRECIVCAAIARRRKYISESEENLSRNLCSEISKMLSGLLNSLSG